MAGPTGAGTGTGKKVVVKQALPYIRVVESWPLTLDRAGFETRALQEQRRLCPELVPEVYHFDPTLALIIMRFIEAPHIILRKALIAGEKFPHFARHLSDFMAKTLFGTSALKLGGKTFRARVSEWSNNSDLCALTEKVVFTDPYSHGKSKSKSKSNVTGLYLYTGRVSCFMRSGALDSSDVLLSYNTISLAQHIAVILIFPLKHLQGVMPTAGQRLNSIHSPLF